MDAAKAAARAFVEKQPASIKIGVVAFSDGALVTQQPTTVRPTCWPPSTGSRPLGATSLGQGIFTSLSAIAGKPISLGADAADGDIDDIDIGYYGSRRSSCSPTARTRRNPIRSRWRELASVAGRAHLPDRHRQPAGHGRADQRLQRGHRARRGPADQDRDGHRRHVLPRQRRRRRWPRSTTTSTCSSRPSPKQTEVTGDRHGRQHRCCCFVGGGAVAALVRAAGVAMSFSTPLALLLLLAVPLLLGAYLWQLRRKRKHAVRFSSVALIRAALPKRSRWRRHVPVALFLASLAGAGRRLGAARRSRPRCRSDARRSSSPSTCPRSMCATDVEPNRLTVAQDAARTFVKDQVAGTRIGIVAFAGVRRAGRAADDRQGRADQRHRQPHDVERHGDRRRHAQGARRHRRREPRRAPSAPPRRARRRPPAPTAHGATPARHAAAPAATCPDIIVLLTDGANTRGIDPVDAAQQAAPAARARVHDRVRHDEPDGDGVHPPAARRRRPERRRLPRRWRRPGRRRRRASSSLIDEPTLQRGGRHHRRPFYRAEDADQLRGVFARLPEPDRAAARGPRDQRALRHRRRRCWRPAAIGLSLFWNRSP